VNFYFTYLDINENLIYIYLDILYLIQNQDTLLNSKWVVSSFLIKVFLHPTYIAYKLAFKMGNEKLHLTETSLVAIGQDWQGAKVVNR
jgi:hypothetical protein